MNVERVLEELTWRPPAAGGGGGGGQEVVHEGDVGDGQPQRLDPGQSLLVRKRRNLIQGFNIFLINL